MSTLNFNIAAVERDTGLSKDVLRMWERRYGFPTPTRDGNGERCYPGDQVERLRLIKRLMDQGHRPGKLIMASTEELAALAPRRSRETAPTPQADAGELDELLALIKQHDGIGYQQAMQQRLGRQGLQRFVQDTIAPLTCRVGQAWEDGSFEVFEEHLFTELTKRLLRQAIAGLPASRLAPRILLTSVPRRAACTRPAHGRSPALAGRGRMRLARHPDAAFRHQPCRKGTSGRRRCVVVLGRLSGPPDARAAAAATQPAA